MKKKSNASKYLQVLLLGFAGGAIYLIPYIRYTFFDWQIAAQGITSGQLDLITTAFMIGTIILYIPGGILADKFQTKTNIIIGLAGTAVISLIFAFTLTNVIISIILWVLLSVSTALFFWGSLFRTLRILAAEKEQGFLFGLYYAANTITGSIISALALGASNTGDASTSSKFFWVVIVYAVGAGIAAFLVSRILKRKKKAEPGSENAFSIAKIGKLFTTPSFWILLGIAFTAYVVYSCNAYFGQYFTYTLGVEPNAPGSAAAKTLILFFVAPVSGLIADKLIKSTSLWFAILFALLVLLSGGIFLLPATVSVGLASTYTLLPLALSLAIYGILFAVLAEAKIPLAVTGTAIGIASAVSYAPNFFLPGIYSNILQNAGANGSKTIFIIIAAVSCVGFLIALLAWISGKKKKTADSPETEKNEQESIS